MAWLTIIVIWRSITRLYSSQMALCNALLLVRHMQVLNRLYYKSIGILWYFNWTKTSMTSSFVFFLLQLVCCNDVHVVCLDAVEDFFFVKQPLNQCFWLFLMLNPCLVIRIISVFIALVTSPMITVMIIINVSAPLSSINWKMLCLQCRFYHSLAEGSASRIVHALMENISESLFY